MKPRALVLVLAAAVGGMSCASKDAVLNTGSGGAGGGPGSGGSTGPGSGGITSSSGGTSVPGGHAGTATGGASSGGQVGSGGIGGHGGSVGSGGAGSGGNVGGGSGGVGGGGRAGSVGTGSVGGETPNDGGTDAFMCEQVQCARPYECIRACGGAIEYTGCCPCVAPLFDNFNNFGCKGMGGAGGKGGAGGATCAQIQAGYAAALPTAKICNEAISSRHPCETEVKTALGCPCTTFVDDASGLKPYQDAWTMAGCSSVCVLGCITLQQAGLCDSPSTTTTQGICKDVPL